MVQQQIDTNSIVSIDDTVIKASTNHTGLVVTALDPWDTILASIDAVALDPTTIVPALDASLAPSTPNYYITESNFVLNFAGKKTFVLVGPTGSDSDFNGNDQTPFVDALAFLATRGTGGWIVVKPGTYTFTSTLVIPDGIRLEGTHPSAVTLTSSGNFPVLDVQGALAQISQVTISAPSATSTPALKLSGQRCRVVGTKITNFGYSGVQMNGYRNRLLYCRIEESLATGGQGVVLTTDANQLNHCSFAGLLSSGAVKIEGSSCGVFASYFASTGSGYAYLILSNSVQDARLVGNHFGSPAALALSADYGTGSVRYGNTPNTFDINQNDWLEPLKEYTGQPALTSTTAATATHFTNDPLLVTDLTAIFGALDLFAQRTFEERDIFLDCTDPVFNADGSPASGVFSWDGTTLAYPTFYLRSFFNNNNWVVNAGSQSIPAGSVLFVDFSTVPSGVDVTLTPQVAPIALAMVNPTDGFRLVLAVAFTSNYAVWLNGFRLLQALTSFDVDGTPLPLVRYIGLTESRNPVPPFNGFAGATQANLTDKLSAQSALIKNLFEQTNVGFNRVTPNAQISMDPLPGPWLSLTSGFPGTPTHVIQLKGTTYALDPATGLYQFHRDTDTWVLTPGNPSVGPFTALSLLYTSAALLTTTGAIITYDPDIIGGVTWTTFSPTFSPMVTALMPFAASRPSTFATGGQADFAEQTANATFFTTLGGYTVRFNALTDVLDYVPRAYTEMPLEQGLLGAGLKDTAFNVLRDPVSQAESLDNGFSYTTGLPVSLGTMRPFADDLYSEFAQTDFSALTCETISHDAFSGAYMAVYKGATKWYIFGGGKDNGYLYSAIPFTSTLFTDFKPYYWLVNYLKQEFFALGRTLSTSTFAVIRGSLTGGVFTTTYQVVGAAANTCQGVVGVVDNLLDVYALVSNQTRGSRPAFYKYDGLSNSWGAAVQLVDSAPGVGEVLVTAAAANSFAYNADTSPLIAFGVAGKIGVSFLVSDSARSSRPTLFFFNRATLGYGGIRLASVAGAGVDAVALDATANSYAQVFGGGFLPSFRCSYWFVKNTSGTVVLYPTFEDVATYLTWTSKSVTGTFTFPFTTRSGTLAAHNHLAPYTTTTTTSLLYLWSTQGLNTITIAGRYDTGLTSATLTSTSTRLPITGLPSFSTAPTTLYQAEIGNSRGGEPSIGFGTRVLDDIFPSQGNGFGLDPGLGGGIFWCEPGTKLQNINNIWVGLNRSGYLYIANAAFRSRQTEYTPNPAITRGDVTVANLVSTLDFSVAANASGSKLCIAFKESTTSKLAVLIYDTTTNGVPVLERTGVVPGAAIASSPRITYNPVSDSWDITAQDDTHNISGGQLAFYRRMVTSGAWTVEYPSVPATNAKNPSAPVIAPNGDVIVATEATGAFNLLVMVRNQASTSWSIVTTAGTSLPGGGFVRPELIFAGGKYWAFGNSDGTAAKVVNTSTYTTWSLPFVTNPVTSFNRVTGVKLFAYSDGVAAASPLSASGVALANQEMGVFRFYSSGNVYGSIFAAKGRQSSSGEEESSYGNVAFSSDGKLIYSGLRTGRPASHWSIRVSRNNWVTVGDSCLGAGRLITIGGRHFRENYPDTSGQAPIEEYTSAFVQSWSHLPIAERDVGNYVALRYPFLADGAPSSLFANGNPNTSMVADATLQSGTFPTALASRAFPLLAGSTRVQGGVGASVLYHGALAVVAPPPTVSNATYFGSAAVASSNMLKSQALNYLTFKGTWQFVAPNDNSRTYTMTGPISFLLDSSTLGHLVLDFPVASSLTLDATANPLTYWTYFNYSQVNYAVVLGELQPNHFLIYGRLKGGSHNVKLTLGALEPRELTESLSNVRYYALPSQYSLVQTLGQRDRVEVIAIDSVSVKLAGSLKGVQNLQFASISGDVQLLLAQGLPPLSLGYYFFRTATDQGASALEGMRLEHVVGRFNNLVVFNAY